MQINPKAPALVRGIPLEVGPDGRFDLQGYLLCRPHLLGSISTILWNMLGERLETIHVMTSEENEPFGIAFCTSQPWAKPIFVRGEMLLWDQVEPRAIYILQHTLDEDEAIGLHRLLSTYGLEKYLAGFMAVVNPRGTEKLYGLPVYWLVKP